MYVSTGKKLRVGLVLSILLIFTGAKGTELKFGLKVALYGTNGMLFCKLLLIGEEVCCYFTIEFLTPLFNFVTLKFGETLALPVLKVALEIKGYPFP
jgi:hypothetical protein